MKKHLPIATLALTCSVLAACGGSSNNNSNTAVSTPSYEITVVNLTNNQPLSPVAVIAHTEAFSPWAIGTAASEGLERLAEGGDNGMFIGADIADQDAVGESGAGIVPPGSSETFTVSTNANTQNRLTIATMFVNTNDAFVGLGGVDVSGLAVGDSITRTAPIYDAGTEANTEAAGTIPGPADGGTGFDATRDDIGDRVSRHSGVVSVDDGLTTSVLNESHRFDAPGIRVTITRQ
ncbi:MAG: spondin domain-containing protein [Pseudomonadota bacterium]